MGSPPPSPPVITLFEPVWDYLLYYYQTTGILFQLTVNQASQFFIYLEGVLVGQSPSDVTTWTYTFPTTPSPRETPYIVRAVSQNSNGSSESIRHMVITPTPVTSAPVLQKVNPSMDPPDILVNTSIAMTIVVSVDQWSTVSLKIDGKKYGSSQYVSIPGSVTFTIGLDYLNNPDNIGKHTTTITAENNKGTSNELTYSWNLIGLMNALLSGNIIIDNVRKWRTRPNKNSPWGSWQDANHCNLNAAINYVFAGCPTQAEQASLENYQWKYLTKIPETDSDTYAQPYIPLGGPKGLMVYHIKRIGPDSCPNAEDKGHAMLAFYHGPATDEGYQTWANWEIFQYGVRPVTVGIADCSIGQDYENQIPRPIIPDEVVTIQISYINCIVVDPTSGPSLQQGTTIVTFYVHSTGDPTIYM